MPGIGDGVAGVPGAGVVPGELWPQPRALWVCFVPPRDPSPLGRLRKSAVVQLGRPCSAKAGRPPLLQRPFWFLIRWEGLYHP